MSGRTKEGRYLSALAHAGTMKKRFPSAHWRAMDIGGRIPPLLEAFALLFRRILPWLGIVMHPTAMQSPQLSA
jgi:hypothetical protein